MICGRKRARQRARRSLYFSSLTFDVAISAIPTTSKLILTGTGISWSPKNKIALLKQNRIPPINWIGFAVLLYIIYPRDSGI